MAAFSVNVLWNGSGLPCALSLDLGAQAEFSDWANLAQECLESWLPSLRAPVFARLSPMAWHQMTAAIVDGSITAEDSEIFAPFYFVTPPEVWHYPASDAAFSKLSDLGFKTIVGSLQLDKPALALISKASGAELSCSVLPSAVCKNLAQKITHSGRTCFINNVPNKPLAREFSQETAAIFGGPALFTPDFTLGGAKKLEATSAKALKLLQMANSQVDLSVIEEELRQDATCSYKLITMINSAGLRTQKAVSSVHDAILFLGYSKLSQWLSMLLLSSAAKPYGSPALRFSLSLRAKIAESIALIVAGPRVADTAFCAALFNGLDALFDKPLEDLVRLAGITGPLRTAIMEQGGPSGNSVRIAKSFELSSESAEKSFQTIEGNAIDVHKVLHQALGWAIGFQSFSRF